MQDSWTKSLPTPKFKFLCTFSNGCPILCFLPLSVFSNCLAHEWASYCCVWIMLATNFWIVVLPQAGVRWMMVPWNEPVGQFLTMTSKWKEFLQLCIALYSSAYLSWYIHHTITISRYKKQAVSHWTRSFCWTSFWVKLWYSPRSLQNQRYGFLPFRGPAVAPSNW